MNIPAPLHEIISLLGARLGQLDPVSLAPFQGKLILLEVTGIGSIYLLGSNGGLSSVSASTAPMPDLHLRGTLPALLQLARTGGTSSAVTLTGDTELAQALQAVLASAPLLAETLVAQLVGDTTAGVLAGMARQAGRDAQHAEQAMRVSLRDYLQTEAQIVPTPGSVADFNQAVDVLRDDVARLTLRVQRLQSHIATSTRQA